MKLIKFNTIKFIAAYRQFETSSMVVAFSVIRQAIQEPRMWDHFCGSWMGKDGNFGRFYLNLSSNYQYDFLKYWGVFDDAPQQDFGQGANDSRLDPFDAAVSMMMIKPHELLKFFLNNAIDTECAEGVRLSILPDDDKRYGDSGNWAEYILSLPDDEQKSVLNQISNYLMIQS